MIATQYIIKSTDDGIEVTSAVGTIDESGYFIVDEPGHGNIFLAPGMYASVPGRLMTLARELSDDCGCQYLGLKGDCHV